MRRYSKPIGAIILPPQERWPMTIRPSRRLAQAALHKVFLWDLTGVYVDYWALNPVHGHFVHPQAVVGAHIRDVLSRQNSRVLRHALAVVQQSETAHSARLTFQRDRREYQSTVWCVPSTEGRILGLVVDTLKPSSELIDVPHDSSRIPWSTARYATLTKTEKTILTLLDLQPLHPSAVSGNLLEEAPMLCNRMGLTNKEIARHLGTTVRTIKAHVSNIYCKLTVASPHQRHIS